MRRYQRLYEVGSVYFVIRPTDAMTWEIWWSALHYLEMFINTWPMAFDFEMHAEDLGPVGAGSLQKGLEALQ